MEAEIKKHVEVCITPKSFGLYNKDYKVCVVIDVLRATSAICTAIENGVEKIIPVSTVEEAREYKNKGFIAGAERNGKIVEGFSYGNSPYSYMGEDTRGKTIVLTTTNGTRAINIASSMDTVVIGSLNNLDVLCKWLIEINESTLIMASGWKDKFNLEDTICAGAIVDQLIDSGNFIAEEDSTIAAKFIFKSAKENIFSFLKASSHRRRLHKLNLNKDVKYCLTPNNLTSIPVLKDGEIVKLNYVHEEEKVDR